MFKYLVFFALLAVALAAPQFLGGYTAGLGLSPYSSIVASPYSAYTGGYYGSNIGALGYSAYAPYSGYGIY